MMVEEGLKAKVFMLANSEKTFSLNDIWLWEQHQQDFYAKVPMDGTCVTQVVYLRPPKGEVALPFTDGLRYVKEIELTLDLWHEREEQPIEQGAFYTYSDLDGQTVQRAEFETPLKNLDVRMGFQTTRGSHEVAYEIEVQRRTDSH